MATYKLTKPAKEHLLIDGKDVVQKMQWEQMQEEMRKIMEEPATRLRIGDRDMEVMNQLELMQAAKILQANKSYSLAIVFVDMYEADIKKKTEKEKINVWHVAEAIKNLRKSNPTLTTKDILTNKATISQLIDLIVQVYSNKRTTRKSNPVKPFVDTHRKPDLFVRNSGSKKPLNLTHVFKKGEAQLATTKSKRKVDLSKLVSKVQGNYN